MILSLKLFTIFSLALSLFSLQLNSPTDIHAASYSIILGTNPISSPEINNTNLEDSTQLAGERSLNNKQEVNFLSKGIYFNYLIRGVGNFSSCTPVSHSVNSESVQLLSTQDSRSHPLHTLLFSDSPSQHQPDPSIGQIYSFGLSISQPGYELQPNTAYKLRLVGGQKSIKIKCITTTQATKVISLINQDFIVAFTTTNDHIPPIISSHITHRTSNAAVITWTTSDLQSSSTLNYGIGNYNSSATIHEDPSKYSKPYATLSNLKPNSTYQYKIVAKDKAGNPTESKGSFTTWDIGPVKVTNITGSEATIAWKSSELTDSAIYFSTNRQQLNDLSQPTPGVRRSHSLESATTHNFRLVDLDQSKKYYARIELKRGMAKSLSSVFSFTTKDLSGGFVIEPPPNDLEFTSSFDLSEFNFKDFPPDDLEASGSGQEASGGAVLASTDAPLESIAGNFSEYITAHPWLVWLWVPVLILLALIVAVWLLWRHEKRIKRLRIEAKS